MKALDKEGLDYLANKVYDAINSGGSADYIVEEGTSGIWTYRKWASGIAECWGDDTQSVTAYATILSGMQNFRKTVNLPSNLFTRIDDVNFNCVVANTTTFPVNIGGTSTTSIDVIASALTTATTAQSFRSRMLVKGLWKAFTPSVSRQGSAVRAWNFTPSGNNVWHDVVVIGGVVMGQIKIVGAISSGSWVTIGTTTDIPKENGQFALNKSSDTLQTGEIQIFTDGSVKVYLTTALASGYTIFGDMIYNTTT